MNYIDTVPDFQIKGEQYYSSFGWLSDGNGVIIPGDLNGDKYDDVVVLASSFRSDGEQVGKIYIYSYKKVSDVQEFIPADLNDIAELKQNYPNPFNPVTKIPYEIKQNSHVSLTLFNTLGARVSIIEDGYKNIGLFTASLDARSLHLNSGAYFVEMIVSPLGSDSYQKKLIKILYLK